MVSNVEIKIVDSWNKDEIVNLYKAGGWWKKNYKSSGIKQLISGSFAFAVGINNKKAIGMGRVISDSVSDAYIQDLVVLPEYRNRGIGEKIVRALIKCCKKKGIKWIGLISEPNQDIFYKKIGFNIMENYVPMKYKEIE